MEKISLVDMHNVNREYSFEIISKTVKKGKSESTQKWVIFHTTGEDDLRFIEDISEEICKTRNLPLTTARFFERNQSDEWWEIEMRWDNGRYRGTCFVILPSDPRVEQISPEEKKE